MNNICILHHPGRFVWCFESAFLHPPHGYGCGPLLEPRSSSQIQQNLQCTGKLFTIHTYFTICLIVFLGKIVLFVCGFGVWNHFCVLLKCGHFKLFVFLLLSISWLNEANLLHVIKNYTLTDIPVLVNFSRSAVLKTDLLWLVLYEH